MAYSATYLQNDINEAERQIKLLKYHTPFQEFRAQYINVFHFMPEQIASIMADRSYRQYHGIPSPEKKPPLKKEETDKIEEKVY